MDNIAERFKNIQEVEADADDLIAIGRIENEGDLSEGVTLAEMDLLRSAGEYSYKWAK